ncbi:MAG: prenyltransferase/squalene oxidase repeat-containing protein [Planctomycetota bacterium]
MRRLKTKYLVPALLVLAVLYTPIAGAGQLPSHRDPDLRQKASETMLKAVEWLRKRQDEDGRFDSRYSKEYGGGPTAVALLTLLKSGISRDDEVVRKGFAFLRKQPVEKVYSAGFTLMALEARWSKQNPVERMLGESKDVTKDPPRIPDADLEWIKELVRQLISWNVRTQTRGAADWYDTYTWGYPQYWGDHNNTHHALLAFRSAIRCGVLVPKEVWERNIERFLSIQEMEGPEVRRVRMVEDRKTGFVGFKESKRAVDHARGWFYSIFRTEYGRKNEHVVTGSMTCVGISSLMLALEGLRASRRKIDVLTRRRVERSINDGLAWLSSNFSWDSNPGTGDEWTYCYLAALERAGTLCGVRNVGKHDWYRKGAEWLIEGQRASGSWISRSKDPLVSTCMAVLFLTRATLPSPVKIKR